MKVKIKKLHPDAIIPKYHSDGASGFDFHILEDTVIHSGITKPVRTGLSFEIPKGYELQVRPRSGTSLKTKLRIANSPGTVDNDFRGEVCLLIDDLSLSNDGFRVLSKGERIAQGVIAPVIQAEFEEVTDLNESERGNGRFGSTGK